MAGIHSIQLLYGKPPPPGRLVHVHDAPRGGNCGLVCPTCNGDIVAKKGEIRSWHFAHMSGIECVGAAETALHIRAKEIIANSTQLLLPALTTKQLVEICRLAGHTIDTSSFPGPRFWATDNELQQARYVSYSSASVEKRIDLDSRSITADVVLHGNHDIVVEIHFGHAVDADKARAIQAAGLTAIEIRINLPADTEMNDGEYVDYVLTKASRKHLTLASADLRAALELVPSSPPERIERPAQAPIFVDPAQPARPPWQSWRPTNSSKLRAMQREFEAWSSAAETRRSNLEISIRDFRKALDSVTEDSAEAEELRRQLAAAEEELRVIEAVHAKRGS
jgi:competence protein CoiA